MSSNGGYDSAGLGNKGKGCSLTIEFKRICKWISNGSGEWFSC